MMRGLVARLLEENDGMADCPRLSTCRFFNDQMAGMPSIANVLKQKYCQGDYQQCARYLVLCALGADAVPDDLFPDDRAEANKLIARLRSDNPLPNSKK
jgi:hypothetical protein